MARPVSGNEGQPAPTVYLVGAGPGDPDLLTVKALRLLETAEVVVYDRLVSQAVLDLIPAGTARIYAGKASGAHSRRQNETNELLVNLALSGRRVLRLKGGDPLVFGRGGEEACHLASHGIACEIVPGITAAAGCAASAGIPLTQRGLASGVRFITGHCRDDRPLDFDWKCLADPETTLVVYMGLAHLSEISGRLIEAGLPADTPAVAIAKATLPDEEVVVASLAGLADRVKLHGLTAPVICIIGRVVDVVGEINKARQYSEGRATRPDLCRHA